MKKVIFYTECPDKNYYISLYTFAKNNDIKIIMQDSRFIYLTSIYLNNNFSIIRKLREILTGNGNIINYNVKLKDILSSLLAPFKIIFKYKTVITGFAPYSSSAYFLFLLKLLGKDIIYETSWSYWGDYSRYVHNPKCSKLIWKLFLNNTKVVAYTYASKNSLDKFNPNIYVISHSIDASLFHKKKSKKLTVLYVGRLMEEKGIKDLLAVAKSLKDINFIFVGKGPLEHLFKKTPSNVNYLGFIKDKQKLADIYSSSDIFVLNSYKTKSWEEWFGIVLLEAMAATLAIITTDCTGPKEVIQNNVNGLIINQKNKDQLKEAIEKLAKDKELLTKLSKNAKESSKNYDVKEVSKLWKYVFNS
jgi:glycosyltransferase involved in cell wall biosynthesis